MRRRSKVILGAFTLATLACAGWCLGVPCWLAWLRWGFLPDTCPTGEPRLVVEVNTYGLERDREGSISVYARASFLERGSDYPSESPLTRYAPSAELAVGDKRYPLDCDWDGGSGYRGCSVALPSEVPDGDHALIIKVDTGLSEDPEIKVDLPLYRPALIQVLTDRPLYEPGDELLFRSIALSRADLSPLDARPGTWVVTDPNGEVLLEERSPGGPWGISASSFPLADDASPGTWTVTYRSGDESASATVRVEPFTLPRFTVELQPDQPWYGIGAVPAVVGRVLYTSGAPVANANLRLELAQQDAWPLPNEWTEPVALTTDRFGNFRYTLPPVPGDVVDRARVGVLVTATDAAGDQLRGGSALLFSRDPIAVDAVTELGDGLVPDFNNRAYLRVSTPDGQPLPDREVRVRNPRDPRAEPKVLRSDADGVIALRIDPGQPISVLVPAQPVRPARPSAEERPLVLANAQEAMTGRPLRIQEQVQLEAVARGATSCATLVSSERTLRMGAVVQGGRVSRVEPSESAAERCLGRALAAMTPGGGDALLITEWRLRPPREMVRLNASVSAELGEVPDGLSDDVADAVFSAGACAASVRDDAGLGLRYLWRVSSGDRKPSFLGLRGPDGVEVPGLQACLDRALGEVQLAEPAEALAIGIVSLSIDAPEVARSYTPQPTVMQGFEFDVEVVGVGKTAWRVSPGQVPAVRLRPSSVLLDPGAAFEVEILRGPDFQGELPDGLTLMQGDVHVQSCPRTKKAAKDKDRWSEGCPAIEEEGNKVRFSPDATVDGFLSVALNDARAVVYVRPKGALSVELSTDAASYTPGARAQLTVTTSSPAVVSLVGLDTALGQLAPLPGPGVLGDAVVTARSDNPAFGTLDAVALATGRIRGDNAAMAAVQRVSDLGAISPVAAPSNRSGSYRYNPDEELTAAFYELLFEAQGAVRDWEKKTPAEVELTNEVMAELWSGVLEAREDAGKPAEDAWGRPLELWLLPDDLLSLTDPRALVRDGTRLPEDVVAWNRWVREELDR